MVSVLERPPVKEIPKYVDFENEPRNLNPFIKDLEHRMARTAIRLTTYTTINFGVEASDLTNVYESNAQLLVPDQDYRAHQNMAREGRVSLQTRDQYFKDRANVILASDLRVAREYKKEGKLDDLIAGNYSELTDLKTQWIEAQKINESTPSKPPEIKIRR